jgi:O-antigen ligase
MIDYTQNDPAENSLWCWRTLLQALIGILCLILVWMGWTYVPRFAVVIEGLVAAVLALVILQRPIVIILLVVFVALASVSSVLPNLYSPLVFAALGSVLLRMLLSHDFNLPFPMVVRWAIGFFTWWYLSVLWSNSYDYFSFAVFYRVVPMMIVISAIIVSSRDYLWVILSAGAAIILTAVLSVKGMRDFLASGNVLQQTGLTHKIGQARYYGQWSDPNFMAQSIAPFLFISYALIKTRLHWFYRTMSVATVISSIIVILLSLSRGALLCLALGLVLIFSAEKKRWLFLGGSVVLIFITSLIFPIDLLSRIETLLPGHGDASISQRTQLILAGLEMAIRHFPFGVGLGNFRTFSSDFAHSLQWSMIPHNTYIQILAECGIIGLLLYLGSIASVLKAVMPERWRFDPDNLGNNLKIGLSIAIIVSLLSYMFLAMADYFVNWMLLSFAAIHPMVYQKLSPKLRN